VGRFLVSLLATASLLLVLSAGASAQTIVNASPDASGLQQRWLETWTTGGETGNNANIIQISALVQHPTNRTVTGLKIDDNWDGTDNTSTVATKSVTPERPNVNGGYGYSRVTFSYQFPVSGTGMSCGFLSGTRRTTKQVRIRAVLDNGALSPPSTSDINFTSTGQCTGPEDYAYIYQRSQTATSITPGQSVTFTYTGDDPDSLTGDNVFNGVRWRMRRLSDGFTTSSTVDCPNNGDNQPKNLTVEFPSRGRWVVEAETMDGQGLDGSGCDTADNAGRWWRLGSVDVNSAASSSPTISLNATRPQINGNTTVTATVGDPSDSGQGGVAEDIEWDLDGNTSNGVNGFEDTSLGDWLTGLTSAQKQRTINTTGMTPGLHTVRARVGDNGALGGADNIRRTNIGTTTFLVDHPPVINDQNRTTETGDPLNINLGAVDADGDTLSYTVTDPPDHGSLAGGTTGTPTYTSDSDYAGNDSFTVQISDGFGGTDTATISIRVDPQTSIDSGPTGTVDDRSASFDFSSPVPGATFECSLDGAAFDDCTEPVSFSDLSEGAHQFQVRAIAAGNTDPTPATRNWTVDAVPVVTITSGPDAETADTTATFEFSSTETGATQPQKLDCKLDGGDFRPCDSPYTYTDVDDGDHTFVVRATDAYGKTDTDEYDWKVDAVGSNTVIDDAPPARTGSTDAHLAFSSPDQDATFECKLDADLTWTACTSPQDFAGVSEGTHTFKVRAVDTANIPDPTPAQAKWTVDLTPPDSSFTSGPDGLTNDPTPTFEFKADEAGATFECNVDGGGWNACSSPITLPNQSDGSHTIEVRATDDVGNVEADADAASRTFEVDTQAPTSQITGGPAEGSRVSATTATLSFTSPDSDAHDFRCKLDGGPWTACNGVGSQTYNGLADGDHQFSVRAMDDAGNIEASPSQRSWIVDSTPPQTTIVSGPSGTVRQTDATFQLKADDADATFECSLDGAAFQACPANPTLTGLADGTHSLAARGVDELGNTDASPAVREWTVDTSTEAPPKSQDPRKKRKCTFVKNSPHCGDPYIRARASAAHPGRGKGSSFGKVVLKANGGGAPLDAVAFRVPSEVKASALKKGARIGQLQLFGFKKGKAIPIEANGTGLATADGPPRIAISKNARTVKITKLPAKVRRLRLSLASPSLRVESPVCGTKSWKATMVDLKGNVAEVSTAGDVHCPKGGGDR
jgi:hypothetical protein